jgi:hypothetical protein
MPGIAEREASERVDGGQVDARVSGAEVLNIGRDQPIWTCEEMTPCLR